MTDIPKRKRDWAGRWVRLRRTITNIGGSVFPAGSVLQVTVNHGGLRLATRALDTQSGCYRGLALSKVAEYEVELLPLDYHPEADPLYYPNMVQELITLRAQLAATHRLLTERTKVQLVVREADFGSSAVLGVFFDPDTALRQAQETDGTTIEVTEFPILDSGIETAR